MKDNPIGKENSNKMLKTTATKFWKPVSRRIYGNGSNLRKWNSKLGSEKAEMQPSLNRKVSPRPHAPKLRSCP